MKAAETLSDGLEKLEQIVKPLRWDRNHRTAGYFIEVDSKGMHGLCKLNTATGSWSMVSIHKTLTAAKRAAEDDHLANLASALNLDPILSEIKRMREALGDGRSARWAAHYDIPDHLGWDLRMIADGKDQRAGFETMDGAIMRRAASCFDGLPESTTSDEAMSLAREALSTHQDPTNDRK